MQKMVDKYVFDDTDFTVDNGIQTFIAYNQQHDKKYVMKRFRGKVNSHSKIYDAMMNQANIVKNIKSQVIYKCIKILRTSHSIYMIYDYFQGQNLEKFIQQKQHQVQKKLQLLLNILKVIQQLIKSGVVHCNINPNNIIVDDLINISIVNFSFAHSVQGSSQGDIKFQPPITVFVPPQISQKKVYHHFSDLHSFGMICKYILQNDLKNLSKKFNETLSKLIQPVSYRVRPSISYISKIITQQKSDVLNNKKNVSIPNLNLHNKQVEPQYYMQKLRHVHSDRKIIHKNRKNSQSTSTATKNYSSQNLIKQILRERSYALFLLKLSKTCFNIVDESTGLLTGFKFMQISTQSIQSTYKKYCQYQNNQSFSLKISRGDNFKIQLCLRRESTSQRKKLDDMIQVLKSQLIQQELKFLQGDKNTKITLQASIKTFLREIFQQGQKQLKLDKSELIHLYLMSQILIYKSIQKIFFNFICAHDSQIQNQNKFSQEELFRNLYKYTDKQLIQKIQKRINQ